MNGVARAASGRERDGTMEKIRMLTPLVEMDGDEMTRVLWQKIKEKLLLPYIDLQTEYYDLGLRHRDETADQVTVDSAEATLRLGVAVKCATITPNAQRVEEYGLQQMWKSPNGTIRAILDGTVFREPVLVRGVSPCVCNWKKPITIARHAYGDVYKNVEFRVPGSGEASLCFTDDQGRETRLPILRFKGSGILQGLHNTDQSILSFAHSCFQYALYAKQDLWFSTKDTISKTYDHHFKDIFQDLYDTTYRDGFQKAGISYFYTLIDDAVARVIRSEGARISHVANGQIKTDAAAPMAQRLAALQAGLAEVIAEMVDYTISHFAFEEALMESAGYMFSGPHKKVHDLFTRKVAEMQSRFDGGEDVTAELHGMLSRWLFNHIRNEDHAYIDSVQAYQRMAVSERDASKAQIKAEILKELAEERGRSKGWLARLLGV